MTRQTQLTVGITIIVGLCAATAQAQSYPPCPAPTEPCTLAVCEMTPLCPTPPVAVPAPPAPMLAVPMRADVGSIHRYLLNTNPDYRSARRSRTAGILLSTIGGSLGMLVAVAGAVACNDESPCGSEDKAVAYGGLIVGVLSLGIGIPVAVSGQRRMREIRTAYLPSVGLAVGPNSGRVQAAWRF